MKKILNEKNIILFIIFISMLSLNYLYPYISDDYTYMYKYDNFYERSLLLVGWKSTSTLSSKRLPLTSKKYI